MICNFNSECFQTMATLLQCLLLIHILFIVNLCLVWTLHIDLMLNGALPCDCPTPLTCKREYNNHSRQLTLAWKVFPNDFFAAAKAVNNTQDHIILQASHSQCRLSYFYSKEGYNSDNISCFPTCSEIFEKHRSVFIQTLFVSTGASRQSYVENIARKGNFIDAVIGGIGLITNRQKWKNYILITSNHEELTAVQRSLQSRLLFTLDEEKDLSISLSHVFTMLQDKDLNFIVVCSSARIPTLLYQANRFESEMMKHSRWLMVAAVNNALYLSTRDIQMKTTDVVVLDYFPCSSYYPVADVDRLVEYFTNANNIPDSYDPEDIEKITARNDPFISNNIYLIRNTLKGAKLVKGGQINNNSDLVLTEELFPGNKFGLNNRTFIVTLLKWEPFVYKRKEKGSVHYSGICLDLLQELASSLNFSYKLIEPEDQEFGRMVDGNWTGMVDLVAKQKADLLLGPLIVDASRATILDFTMPFFVDNSAVLLKKQDVNTNKWKTLVSPFRYEVYICIFFSLIFSTILLYFLEEVNPFNMFVENRPSDRRRRYGDILWYHFGALMANGGAYVPNTHTGRNILGCWWLFTVIFSAIYSGNLIAFLTDWRENPPFSTLTEMVNQDTYHWGTLGGTYYINLFQTSNRSEYKKIWNGMVAGAKEDPDVLSFDSDVHLQKLLHGHYAYISDQTNLRMWENEYCDLWLLREVFSMINLAIGLPKNSSHTRLFSNSILRISESGLMNLWYKRWMPRIYCETPKSAKRVELLALQSAFYAVGTGVFLALSVLITEIFYNRKTVKNNPITCNYSEEGSPQGNLADI